MLLSSGVRSAAKLLWMLAGASSCWLLKGNPQQSFRPHILRHVDGKTEHLSAEVERVLRQQLDVVPEKDRRPLSYIYNHVDLNDDGTPELLVYLLGADVCGSGGCSTLLFRQQGRKYLLMGEIGLTRTPILVSDKKSHGWRDLIVFVVSGGIQPGYYAVLSFDGHHYSENPTAPPARSLNRSESGVAYLGGHNLFPLSAR